MFREQPLGFASGLISLPTLNLQRRAPEYREEQTSATVWLERMRQPRDAAPRRRFRPRLVRRNSG